MADLPDKYSSLFPYENAREAQKDGMEKIGLAYKNNGIVTMEGACGTGKTLTALVPYLREIRNKNSDAEQVLIVTSVKQQMKAFQEEIKRINESISEDVRPISAITLVSASDLHPYIEQDIIEDGKFEKIDSLREGARKLADEEIHSYTYEDLYKRLEDTPDSKYKYPDEIPSADGIEYDPYYAKYRAEYDSDEDNSIDVIPFDLEEEGLIGAERLRSLCSNSGYCPHSIMRLAIDHMDVVIGNYMHVFDPKTVNRVSGSIIDKKTLAIFDEAHNLVPRVREFLSKSTSLTSISKSIVELNEVKTLLRLSELPNDTVKELENIIAQGEEIDKVIKDEGLVEDIEDLISESATVTGINEIYSNSQKVTSILSDSDIGIDEIKKYTTMLDDLLEVVFDQVDNLDTIIEGESIQLRNPEKPSLDKITEWIKLSNNKIIAKKAESIGANIKLVRDELTEPSKNVKTSSASVGDIFTSWVDFDNTRYYRSIEIKERYQGSTYGVVDWQSNVKAELTIHNCIPRDEISKTIDIFKSTVLMSATLEPMDVYKKTTGIKKLEEDGREVYESRYGLAFPGENRITIGISADKFKYTNRGPAFDNFGPNTENDTREQYRDIIFDVVNSTPGNVLIVMPSYNEAEWVGSLLEQSYLCDSEDVFIDKSSSNKETSRLKEDFFKAENGVLVTGARGTLIEGVDYIGDRLNATVVCGVPITNTQSDYKKAIQAAYDEIFDDTDGFTLAFTIPAVWKARQAIGRVIRTKKDIGTRILVDKRYVDQNGWDSVYQYLSPSEQNEISPIPPEDTDLRLDAFWGTK